MGSAKGKKARKSKPSTMATERSDFRTLPEWKQHRIDMLDLHNNINGKIYIGCSIDILHRWAVHKAPKSRGLITKAFNKYGIDNFSFEILIRCPSMCFDYWEKYYINKFSSIVPLGYNIEGGGRYNVIINEETRKKMSISKLGKPNGRKGIPNPNGSIAKLGSKNPMYGKGEDRKGKNNPMYGRSNPHTQERKDNLKDKLKGNTNGNRRCLYNGVEYDSMKDLAKFLNRGYDWFCTCVRTGKFEGVSFV